MKLLIPQPNTPDATRAIPAIKKEVGIPAQPALLAVLDVIAINRINAVIGQFGFMDIETIGAVAGIP
jgi:hypothetical protein